MFVGKNTKIQWTDSTVNPVMGCDGCELWGNERKTCYAGVLHKMRSGHKGYARNFTDPEVFPGRMADAAKMSDLSGTTRVGSKDLPAEPWLDGCPRLLFVSDMGDALSKAITFEYLNQEIIDTVKSQLGSRHIWLWLTKRPERMAKFSQWLEDRSICWPDNLWAGTSVTSRVHVSRMRQLQGVGNERTRRFISAEPQTELIEVQKYLKGIHWVIQGGEAGQSHKELRPFHLEWAKSLRDQCSEAGVPYFLKQLGTLRFFGGRRIKEKGPAGHGGDWDKWPEDLRVREVPTEWKKSRQELLPVAASTPEVKESPMPQSQEQAVPKIGPRTRPKSRPETKLRPKSRPKTLLPAVYRMDAVERDSKPAEPIATIPSVAADAEQHFNVIRRKITAEAEALLSPDFLRMARSIQPRPQSLDGLLWSHCSGLSPVFEEPGR